MVSFAAFSAALAASFAFFSAASAAACAFASAAAADFLASSAVIRLAASSAFSATDLVASAVLVVSFSPQPINAVRAVTEIRLRMRFFMVAPKWFIWVVLDLDIIAQVRRGP